MTSADLSPGHVLVFYTNGSKIVRAVLLLETTVTTHAKAAMYCGKRGASGEIYEIPA